jgi:ornithine carbamoyltransferase
MGGKVKENIAQWRCKIPSLIGIKDLSKTDILEIWESVGNVIPVSAEVAWSFEGNGIRTRATFVQAFQKLGANYVELPNFLKTNESVEDLAGYMDPFFSLYVIRDSNHERLEMFAKATDKPVINAMSSRAHPCEVLTDAYYLRTKFSNLEGLKILLWGPVTNVFRSWHALTEVLNLDVTHYCPNNYQTANNSIKYTDNISGEFDVVITDAWVSGFSDKKYCLNEEYVEQLGNPMILPTPPVTVGNELDKPISEFKTFAGYKQKSLLLPVQMAIISHVLRVS